MMFAWPFLLWLLLAPAAWLAWELQHRRSATAAEPRAASEAVQQAVTSTAVSVNSTSSDEGVSPTAAAARVTVPHTSARNTSRAETLTASLGAPGGARVCGQFPQTIQVTLFEVFGSCRIMLTVYRSHKRDTCGLRATACSSPASHGDRPVSMML